MYETEEKQERSLLVGVASSPARRWEKADSLEELAQLSFTAGVEVVEKILQIRAKPDPRFFIGKGKVREIRELCAKHSIDCIIFDNDLTPAQSRNLEEEVRRKVVDRTELILEVFAQHAKTKAAYIQVELAQLSYRLPRLVGKGVALSRLGGGIGTRGPGEKKLEVDRRGLRERIGRLKSELEKLELTRRIQRKRRKALCNIALVGYTNAGKSSLMNRLTHAEVKVEDKLFTTLDPRTRLLVLNDSKKALLTDTVGLIKDLPHHLVASFHSTLEEVVDAELRLHVVDISDDNYEERLEDANKVLEELDCLDKPHILVFNKIDILPDGNHRERALKRHPRSVTISALTGEGIDDLKRLISGAIFSEANR
jgi:GTP-binding protein HflX